MAKPPPADRTLIVGRHPVREALDREPEHIERVYLQQGGRGLGIIRRAARESAVPVQDVPAQRLTKVAGQVRHQGVVAFRAPLPLYTLESMLAAVAPTLDSVQKDKPLLLVLDRIENPRNFGALMRTAVAAGVSGVIISARRMAPLSAVMIKASAGTATRAPIARSEDLASALEQLKERGYWVLGAAAEADATAWDVDWKRPIALVIGSETEGLEHRIAQACDTLVSIPMPGDVESLNVSVAAGILLFAAVRDRLPSDP